MANKKCIWASMTAGLLAGVTGAFAMDQFRALWSTIAQAISNGEASTDQDVIATRNLAQTITRYTVGHELSEQETKTATSAVHYTMGILMGAAYGIAAETFPVSTACRGTLYGTAMWLFGDEIAAPALGLGTPPSQTPVSSQMSALASHVVYGLTADFMRRLLVNRPL